jgi:PAS domain S-box-containing protein
LKTALLKPFRQIFLAMIKAVWKRFSTIGCHRWQPVDITTVMLTNQVGTIAILILLCNSLIALAVGDFHFAGFVLLSAAFFLPIWWLNHNGLFRRARTYACIAIYGTILFTGMVVLDGHTETYLYCLPSLTAFFVLFKDDKSHELWFHMAINSLIFILMAYSPEGLNWTGLLPENRHFVLLSSRLGSLVAGIAGLYLWFDFQEKNTQAIHNQKKFYESIIDTINLPIAVFDEQLRFRIVNKASFEDEQLRQQVIGKTELDYAAMTGRPRERAIRRTEELVRCFETQQRVLFEEQFEINGYKRTNIGVMSPIISDNGERLVLAYLIDISTLRRYQEQLLQSQKTFEAVFENATDALLLIDTASSQIENCNTAAINLFGCSSKYDFKGKVINDTLLSISPELHEEVVDAIISKGKWEGERVYNRTDGSTFIGSVAVTRFVPQDRQFTLLRINDCSKQKEAERTIEQALHAAREAAEAKSQFLSKISHEIRTPLNAIVGLSRMMVDDHTTIQPINIEMIHQASVSLMEMVNEILNFSKLEAGKETLHPQPANWRALLEQILTRVRWQASRKKLELIFEADPGIPDILMLDTLRMEQIINNLLSNAIKFTEQGYVKVSVTGKALPEKLYRLDFLVADTGIGVPDDKKSIIFESFRQADREIAYKFGGTGLGLAITRQLVEMMNGNISVEDNKGGGAVFKFHVILQVPENTFENQKTTMSDNIPYDLKGLKILMAEDNTVNQFVAKQIMGRWNVSLTFANNGQEAIELLAKDTFDIVLMDIQMPVMDGIEATQHIRNAVPDSGINSKIPIIALTADAMPETKEKVKKAGMNDIVVKPFESDSLYALIRSFVD